MSRFCIENIIKSCYIFYLFTSLRVFAIALTRNIMISYLFAHSYSCLQQVSGNFSFFV